MSNAREHFALDWIKGELDQTLDTARGALESYAEAPDDTRMRSCLTNLHQVHGTVLMLELKGISVLSGEMEEMAQGLLNKTVEEVEAAQQVLMQGILQLPTFLEAIQSGAPDSRKAVLPLANELRMLRGQPAFGDARASSGINLFDSADSKALDKFERIDGLDKARKIRSAYQQVLLAIIKGEDTSAAVSTLNKVAVGLEKICEGTPLAALWRAFNVFISSLSTSGAELNGGIVKLLRRLDAEMKKLAQEGRVALGKPAPIDLVQQLVDAAKNREFQSADLAELDEALEQKEIPAVSGREAMQKAAVALRDEIAAIKDQLDLYVRSGNHDVEVLKHLAAPLKQISSTLSVLGFESSRAVVADQVEEIAVAIDGEEIDESLLMRVAGALLQVDENLVAIASQRPGVGLAGGDGSSVLSEAQIAVIVEARNGLEQIKQAIVDFVASQWDQKQLQEVPSLMGSVGGALAMIPLPRPAALLDHCISYVQREWFTGNPPDWQTLDTFADAVSGIDYYLERLSEESVHPGDDILDLVEKSLSILDARESRSTEEAVPEFDEKIVEETPVSVAETDAVSAEMFRQGEEKLPEGEQFSLEDVIFDELSEVSVDHPAAETSPEPTFHLELDETDSIELPESAGKETVAEVEEDHAPVPPEKVPEADAEIVEIFIEEMAEVLDGVDEWLPRWQEDLAQDEALTELRRAFHTLKGSGRIVGAQLIGEAAWSIENMLNRVIDGTIDATPQFPRLVEAMRQQLPGFGEAFQYHETKDETPVIVLMEQADVLASGGHVEEVTGGKEAHATATESVDDLQSADEHQAAKHEIASAIDDREENFSLFNEEAESHLSVLENFISEHADSEDAELSEEVMRALHTLKGSAAIADITEITGVAGPLYEVATCLSDQRTRVDGEYFDYLSQGVFSLRGILNQLREGLEPEDESEMFAAEADRLLAGMEAVESTLVTMDALPVLLTAHDFFSHWHRGSFDLAAHTELLRALEDIQHEAEKQQHDEIQALSGALRQSLLTLEERELDDSSYGVLDDSQELLLNLFDRIAAHQELLPVTDMVEALSDLQHSHAIPEAIAETLELPEHQDLPELKDHAEAENHWEIEAPEVPPAKDELTPAEEASEIDIPLPELEVSAEEFDSSSVEPEAFSAEELLPEDTDYEILSIFFEEGDELLEAIDQSIHDWSAEPDNNVHLENVLRALHTLKGGARLAGLSALGDASHDFESLLTQFEQDSVPRDEEFFSKLQTLHDNLLSDINAIKGLVSGEPAIIPTDEEEAFSDVEEVESYASEKSAKGEDQPADNEDTLDTVEVGLVEEDDDNYAAHVVSLDAEKTEATLPSAQEMVRVSAALLEELVNLAGENSIVRARIEQGMNDFGSALSEMETTIERVREQLRRLEIETETQVLFRQDSSGPKYTDFDPLEMDRYSHLQQLSRSLSESASDMLDLKDTLSFKSRESETLLLQQARLNTELQEGLMRTRMVPFNRLLPRLRRIVRQVSRELNKKVEFHAYNAEGELDRSVLERMVPPLEHMLRNSIDHGLETPELRRSYGKSATGRIELRLSREAGDVVLEISDDGAGIDVESVRAKAIEKGLMAEDASLSDEEILEFILAAGFTTAKSVTQISGRGVGLDVVASEVKKLGGSIQISSIPGKGTRFLVRLPFTVSVNRALMVTAAEDQYAIPLNSIEGIVRISQQEFRLLNAPNAPAFEYAGVPYRLRYLGNYLGREYSPRTDNATIPVVLVRSGDHAMAIHVDGVQGSREIVVKSLGPQFAGVGGISGATILGDGSVVVILDLLALIRSHTAVGRSASRVPAAREARTRCVMVVDDSVTVRKVTTRLLERQGMDVIVAKDGVEAMALLQERRPDIMLLDIEMPRMDGFEVARQVRHDDRLAELPIIMITSRTGSKHKVRAAELGVNDFLGKPFQESELLTRIDDLVSEKIAEIKDTGS